MVNHPSSVPEDGSPRVVDPFDTYRKIEDLLGVKVPRDKVAIGVALTSALIAAMGQTPAIEGDTMHPRILDGLAALDDVRQREYFRQDRRRR